MPNYELKAEILNNYPEMISLRKEYNREFYRVCHTFGSVKNWSDEDTDYIHYLETQFEQFDTEYQNEVDRIINTDKCRRKRLRKRIENMFAQGTCVFLTLTFTDEVLQNTDEKTRRVYVARFLKSVSTQYVGNVDFGKENGREHYHAVIVSNTDDFSSWTYGFYKAITVRKEEADAKRLATYVSKLTNHAIKETTKRNALIYSR